MMIHRQFEAFPDTDRINEVFERLFQNQSRPTGAGNLPVDVLERDQTLVVRASLPGVQPQDVDVQLEGRVLTIKGSTREQSVFTDAKVYRREVPTGEFSRSIRLPEGLDLSLVLADFDNGLLTVTLPRAESQKPRTIKVEVKQVLENQEASPSE